MILFHTYSLFQSDYHGFFRFIHDIPNIYIGETDLSIYLDIRNQTRTHIRIWVVLAL